MASATVEAEIPLAATLESDTGVSLSKEAQARIEVALYASGRPLSLEELSRVARINSRRRLGELMQELARKINSGFVAIELKEIEGPMYSLQLKPVYNSIAKRFATKPLLSTSTLRTLSYIVYLQPVSAHELVQRRGSQAYGHLKELGEVGFLRFERRGRSRVFTTTDAFADYFGLSRDPDQQRKQVAKQGLISKAQSVEKPVMKTNDPVGP
ncbi:MAG: SMC-Scp complex subunit ScpB [Thaumarchaeota archaeon]|nr:SMC-Scp complex subunit ScpB [Nitrososphaerota archaeon]